jgi:hypothetical protein
MNSETGSDYNTSGHEGTVSQNTTDDEPTLLTDGGTARPNETVELRIRTDRANLAGVISVYGIGIHHAPAFGPAGDFLEDVLDGMEDVYPTDTRVAHLKQLLVSDAPGAGLDVDVELVELEDDPTTDADQDDGDDGDDPDRDGVEIPIGDGGIEASSVCAHRRTRRYGRTDDEGNAVIEVRCASCGRTLSVGGDV